MSQPTSPSRRSPIVPFLLGVLTVGLTVAVLAITGVIDDDTTTASTSTGTTTTSTAGTASSESSAAEASGAAPAASSVSDIYAKASPAVVFISAVSGGGGQGIPGQGGGPGGGTQAASGSGFVVDANGTIVTNEHVVENANQIRVRFGEKGQPITAKLVGEDPSTDVAVLKIDPKKVPGGIKTLPLGESKNLVPGAPTIAIGSPFGLSGTVTTGIVSALDREIQSPNGFSISGVIQTDAAINPGNSGGPLLDGRGRVIGINSQIATNGQSNANSGVGFAVPIDTVKQVVPVLERDGKVARAYLGVSTGDGTGSAKGAVVGGVTDGGPAAKAGLRVRDRITKLDGKAITAADQVVEIVSGKKPGDKLAVAYVRGGDDKTATVTLGTRPDQSAAAQQQP